MENKITTDFNHISPYIRYVNNYAPSWSYEEKERILYDCEFMYVLDGYVDMHYGGKLYRLQKSDILYFKPGIKNHMTVDGKAGFKTHCIHFDWLPPEDKYNFRAEDFYLRPAADKYLKKIEILKKRPFYEPEDFCVPTHIKGTDYEIKSLFKQCYYTFLQQSPSSKIRLKALFMNIIANLAAMYDSTENQTIIHPKIKNAIEYIQNNFSHDIKVSELAYSYGLSPKYFGKIFSYNIGKSVNEFILETRISASRELLAGSDMTIEEIAENTGFSSVYYFSKCFKSHEKLSPGQYRKRISHF